MRKLLILGLITLFIGACNSEKSEEKKEKAPVNPMPTLSVKEIDEGALNLDKLIAQNMPKIDKEQYISAINMHYQFSQNFPKEKKAAFHLDKAQGYCVQIKDFARSEKMLSQLFRDYPDYVTANNGEMYYVRASNLDFLLGEQEKNGKVYKKLAKELYQEFIDKFPENPLVKDAKYRLETMDLSAEDIIKNANP